MVQRHPLTAQRIVGEEIVREGNVWIKYTYCSGYDGQVGLGQEWWGHSGLETRFRAVILHAVAVVDVREPAVRAA